MLTFPSLRSGAIVIMQAELSYPLHLAYCGLLRYSVLGTCIYFSCCPHLLRCYFPFWFSIQGQQQQPLILALRAEGMVNFYNGKLSQKFVFRVSREKS